jgi:hypothetical protein
MEGETTIEVRAVRAHKILATEGHWNRERYWQEQVRILFCSKLLLPWIAAVLSLDWLQGSCSCETLMLRSLSWSFVGVRMKQPTRTTKGHLVSGFFVWRV